MVPTSAFVDPYGRNRGEIDALLHQVGKMLLNFLSTSCDRTPLPTAADLPAATIPPLPTDLAQLLPQLQQLMEQSMNPTHPGYLGHMDPMPSVMSIVGDWVAAGLNNNMLSVEMSPAFSRLEVQLLEDIARRFGLGEAAGGMLVSGGSLANLQAVLVARNVKLVGVLAQGLTQPPQPVLFASQLAHTSVQKAAMVAGLGTESVIPIAVNGQGQMEPTALESAVEQARRRGQHPFMVTATAGTTVTGNIDPLPEIAAIARAEDLWFHVDAAYGGAIAFSPQHRHRLQGIEQADSVTFNPQKWLYVAKTCASLLLRDFSLLEAHFRIAAPYMNSGPTPNLGELTAQGTRHADVLKLWLTLQHLGEQGCAALIDASYELTAVFVKAIHQRPTLQLASSPQMNVICFRAAPETLAAELWDSENAALQSHLLKEHRFFLSLPQLRGHRWLKAVLLNPFTTAEDIQRLFAAIDDFLARPAS